MKTCMQGTHSVASAAAGACCSAFAFGIDLLCVNIFTTTLALSMQAQGMVSRPGPCSEYLSVLCCSSREHV
jgi:hypothetical protein